METVDLSKPSLWTVCVLLLAPQQVLLKPRKNKTWTCSAVSVFFLSLFPSKLGAAGKWSLCFITTPLWFFWKMFKPALKFSYFLEPFYLLRHDCFELECQKRRNSIWPTQMLFTDNWRKSSQVNDRSALNGRLRPIHLRSPERAAIWWSIWLAALIGLGHRWATDGRCVCISVSPS